MEETQSEAIEKLIQMANTAGGTVDGSLGRRDNKMGENFEN